MKNGYLLLRTFLIVAMAFVIGAAAQAQTDVAASLYGSFRGKTTGNGTAESPSNPAGVMLEMRHISNPLIGYELNYSFNRADEEYKSPNANTGACLPDCAITAGNVYQSVKASAHRVGADWFVSVPHLIIKPYALAGVGLIFISPDGGQADTRGNTKPVFEYGVGADWTVVPHLGLRFQYRGDLYHSPDLAKAFTSTNRFTNNAKPMIGAYFRF